jgi:hypothetical protein
MPKKISPELYSFPVLSSLVLITLLFGFFSYNAFATSPSFGLRDIINTPHTWIDVWRGRPAHGANYTDLQDINYYSDGRFLNATLWLASFNPTPPTDRRVNYGMYIDADFNNKTGIQGIDYKIEIQWSGKTKTWTRVFEEWSTNGQNRTLDIKPNYTGFFSKKGEGAYVLLYADLKPLLYPSRYKVLFYAEEIRYKGLSWVMSSSKWIYIPPPQFAISTLPSIVALRAGEQKTIEVQVKSTKGFEPYVHLYTPTKQSYYMRFDFRYDKLRIPSFGIVTTPLTIYTSKDISPAPYTMLISADFTFPDEEFYAKPLFSAEKIKIPTEVVNNQSALMVTVGDPLSGIDIIGDLWNKLGGFINFVFLIGGAVASWIFTTYIKKK